MDSSKTLLNKLISPVGLAVTLAVLLAVWLTLGDHKSAQDEAPPKTSEVAKIKPQVEFKWSVAEPRRNEIVVQGQLLPWQQVAVKAQVTGQIDKVVTPQGTPVKTRDILLELTDEGRSEKLLEAQATLKLRQSELDSAEALKKSKFTSETELSRLSSALAQSKADLVAAKLAVKHSRPAAPFNGIVDRRYVEPGEWVSPGTPLLDLVDISRLKVTADIPQQEVARIAPGQLAMVELLDGRQLQAKVTFISFAANPQTRSYYVELQTENPNLWRVAGSSATVKIQLPEVKAHKFSPALLSLDKNGSLGIFAVDEKDEVTFYPVKLLRVDNEAAIVGGVPERLKIITLGAGFVSPGQAVTPVEAEG